MGNSDSKDEIEKTVLENLEDEKKMKSLFKKYDKDNNKTLDKNEFQEMLKNFSFQIEVATNYKKFTMLENGEWEEVFDDCDIDSDGTISLAEFLKYMKGKKLRYKLEINHFLDKKDNKEKEEKLMKYLEYDLGRTDRINLFRYFSQEININAMQKLIDSGVDINKVNGTKTTQHNNQKYSIGKGSSLFLDYCGYFGAKKEGFKFLLSKKADINTLITTLNPFHTIVSSNHCTVDNLKLFLEHKGDINVRTNFTHEKWSVTEYAFRHTNHSIEAYEYLISLYDSPKQFFEDFKIEGGPVVSMIDSKMFIPVCNLLKEKGLDFNEIDKKNPIVHRIANSFVWNTETKKQHIIYFLDNKINPGIVGEGNKDVLTHILLDNPKKNELLDFSFIKYFLEKKYDPNFVVNKETDPFPLLFFKSNEKMPSNTFLEYLYLFLEHGFLVNTKYISDSGDSVLHLLYKRNDINHSSLSLLIEHKADLNIKNKHDLTVLQQFMIDNSERGKSISTLTLLLENGADPNVEYSNKRTPIFYVEKGIEFIKCLIKYNAMVNHKDKDSITPFLLACSLKNKELIFYLVEMGANINDFDIGGSNAFHYFLSDFKKSPNDYEILKFLLEKGCDPSKINKSKQTPLLFLLLVPDVSTDLIRLFAEYKANPNVYDPELKKTPLGMIKSSEREEVRCCADLFPQL